MDREKTHSTRIVKVFTYRCHVFSDINIPIIMMSLILYEPELYSFNGLNIHSYSVKILRNTHSPTSN